LIEEHIWDLEKKIPLFKVIVNINNKILWVEMFESKQYYCYEKIAWRC
jgi:hypothetical protein